jgi:coenzyme F420-reducing hydrogenase beta subunit
MRPHFLAFRRTLPGGMIVLVSLEMMDEGVVHGVLQVERRKESTRQLFATAPVVAEATGSSKDDVLRKLRALAEDDEELSTHLTAWELEHPSPPRDGWTP